MNLYARSNTKKKTVVDDNIWRGEEGLKNLNSWYMRITALFLFQALYKIFWSFTQYLSEFCS